MKQILPVKDGNILEVYVKRNKFKSFIDQVIEIDKKYEDDLETYLGCRLDETGKHIIIDFVLRSKEDL
jgi:hypothetical protein